MSPTTIVIEDDNFVRTITLHRPESRNALNPTMQQELIAALHEAERVQQCRIVVLRGAGSAFCAGLDLAVLRSVGTQSPEDARADAERIVTLLRSVYELSKPTIAVVHGPAMAGGTGLATVCDITLATPAARFGYTETRIGFIPAIVSVFLALQIAEKQRRELLLTARTFDAMQAKALGLVNEVVEKEQLEERLTEICTTLLSNSPQAIAATKRLLLSQQAAWLQSALAAALEANAAARDTDDFREGVASFFEKRQPQWRQ